MKTYFPYYKRNLKLALPIVLAQLGQIIVQQADIMIVGHLGTAELAAVAFANSIFIFGIVFVMGFCFGLTPAIGHIQDKTQHHLLAKVLTNSYVNNALMTLFFMLLLYLSSFFFQQMGQPQEVAILAKPYFYTQILSMLPLVFFLTNKQFAEGLGDTKNTMYVTLLANALNIWLNYLLIFGKWGFPELGILGAGVATLIARIFMAVGFFLIFKKRKLFRNITRYIDLQSIDKKILRELFELGFPISAQMLLEVAAFAVSGIMAGWLGEISLASHQIALSLASMTFMLAAGVGSATTIRVAHYFSKKDFKNLIMAANASTHIVLAFMGVCGVLLYVFSDELPYFYTNDTAVVKLSAILLIATAIFQLFDGLQVVMLSILRGLGDVKHAMRYAFVAYLLINLPVGYLLAFTFEMGTLGLWLGFIVGLAIAGVLFYSRIRTLYRGFSE